MRSLLVLCLALVVGFSACKKQTAKDQKIIEDYMEDNNITATKTESGLWYRIDPQGTGQMPTLSDNVTVHYKGYLTDGTVFDQTDSQPLEDFPLAAFIEGWKEGLQLVKEGGEILLLIPSHLGYGNRPAGDIPPNSVLIFEVELIEVL